MKCNAFHEWITKLLMADNNCYLLKMMGTQLVIIWPELFLERGGWDYLFPHEWVLAVK